MDEKLFWQLLVTFVVAIVGWWVAHWLTSKRDVENERRKLRITYLIEAYRRLESASHAADPKSKYPALESAIADIQLLGTSRQVTLARAFSNEMALHRTASTDELLPALRAALRVETSLHPRS